MSSNIIPLVSGRSMLGKHQLDLLSKSNTEIVTIGNQQQTASVRIYDNDDPMNGYLLQKSSNSMYFLADNNQPTSIGIGTQSVSSNATLHVQGTLFASNLGTYNTDNNLYLNSQNIANVNNIYYSGDLIKNGAPVTNNQTLTLETVRYTTVILNSTNQVDVSVDGAAEYVMPNIKVYVNGLKMSYIDDTHADYIVSKTFDGESTYFTFTFTVSLNNGDYIDITIFTGTTQNSVNNTQITASDSPTITFSVSGSVPALYIKDAEVFMDGRRLIYISPSATDFTMDYNYDGTNTNFTFVLGASSINVGSIIDITIWYSAARQYVLHKPLQIISPTQSTFTFTTNSVSCVFPQNVDIFYNGVKFVYVTDQLADFNTFYVARGSTTEITITLSQPVYQGDIVDITVWLGDGQGNSGLYSQWAGTSPIYYTSGNVGIGTTNPSALLQVSGDFVSDTLRIGNKNNFVVQTESVTQRYNNALYFRSGKGNVLYTSLGDTSFYFDLSWTGTVSDQSSFRMTVSIQMTNSYIVGNKYIEYIVNPSNTSAVLLYSTEQANTYIQSIIAQNLSFTSATSLRVSFNWTTVFDTNVIPYTLNSFVDIQAPDIYNSFNIA